MTTTERQRAMVTGCLVDVDGVEHYRIDGVEEMEPFLTTVVSDSDLWMFASSTGVLTAGRGDADHAIFPYATDDKLHRAVGHAGPVTVIDRAGERWRPFAVEPTSGCTRSLAKSVLGDRLVFEERHDGWGLVFRATWTPSSRFGWVRTVELVDVGGHGATLEVLDGVLDVMPAGVDAGTEQGLSNLVDAYKRSETGPWGTLAVYTLESLITDRAEPAEALTATTVWSAGFEGAQVDVDERAAAAARRGRSTEPRRLVTGRPGAYLLRGPVTVAPNGSASWLLVADTGRSHHDVAATAGLAGDPDAVKAVLADVEAGSARLRDLLAGADGFQTTADRVADAHHLSNVLFNSMRGGVFPYGHRVPIADLADFLRLRNRQVAERSAAWIASLERSVDVAELRAATLATGDPDLIRLVLEYLPLTFSRRHGDPSRPWNRFSIEVRNDDGTERLAYEGNWRDIFQNWEALLHSFPAYLPNVVAKFVNASTIDGHNPYRISRDGVDWEVPDPEDPWSHIGYWGDHQIVYLLRLLEAWERFDPGAMRRWFDRAVFVYADVPYAIADFDDMVIDPRNTITYDRAHDETITGRTARIGTDGQLVFAPGRELLRVGLLEKLLVPALGKISSLVPDGGIWLNTQRPEWNDANNALAGPGLSMVTLYHLYRYLPFVAGQLDDGVETVTLSASVARWFADLLEVVDRFPSGPEPIDDRTRRTLVDALGTAATEHRHRVRSAVDHTTVDVPVADVQRFCRRATEHLAASIRRARRGDGLYHSYNVVSFPGPDEAHVDHLGPMLEGQVAALSSGALTADESLDLVDALFESDLYRADQGTFMLYPAVELPPFLERNAVPAAAASTFLTADGRIIPELRRVLVTDGGGRVWFHHDVVNAAALHGLLDGSGVPDPVREAIAEIHEDVFRHGSFTGRSASMYGYEGIGSVYWHMVGKLLLAVQETYWSAIDGGAPEAVADRLAAAYRRIRSGLGFRKEPAEFGAFPTDCYSHTPHHSGAQQPGMTGQVKEEVLTRMGELGLRITGGRVALSPGLLPDTEVVPTGDAADAPARASFTFCSVAMSIGHGASDHVVVHRHDGTAEQRAGLRLTDGESRDVLARDGSVTHVEWTTGPDSERR